MLFNYLKIAFRTLLKFKGYAIINLTGLALGLASGILIMVYVLDELSYDSFHTKSDRLFRVSTAFDSDRLNGVSEKNGWPIGEILRKDFPETEAVLYTTSAWSLMIDYDGKKVREKIHYASPEFFEMFSFPVKKGNPNTMLNEPYSIVISEDMETKYFADGDAVGRTMMLNDTLQFLVTGVMRNIPSNSHIQLTMVASFATFQRLNPDFRYTIGWGNINMRNYVLLKPGVNAIAFQEKVKNIYLDKAGAMLKSWGMEAYVILEPFPDVYLKSKGGNGMGPLGSINTVYILSGVGLFVILLACINFINLATARSVYRAKEVGIRKVVGSTRVRLMKQFLSESFVVTLLSFVLAIVIVGPFLPMFNQLVGKNYNLLALLDFKILVGIVILISLIALLSGYYPAIAMSSLKPAEILKGKMQGGSRGVQLRRTLVVVQFVISVGFVAGTLIIIRQLDYMRSEDLGFTKDEIFVINVANTKLSGKNSLEAFQNELQTQTLVKNITFCNALPAVSGWRGQIAYPEGKTGDDAVDMEYMAIDENYLSTLDLKLAAGRNFDLQRRADLEDGLLINEKAVAVLGWETPENAIGKKITSPSGYPAGRVIGVVKDYHDQGLQQPIVPMAMDYNPRNSYLFAIRYPAAETVSLITLLEATWKKYFSQNDFNYFFLDETFALQYQSEHRLARVFTVFSGITIIIAVIGLFGLVSFLVTSKTKEIGVRKVLGASVLNLTRLLSAEFILLVGVANGIALPLTWYFAREWLQTFAYRMELGPLIFVLTVLIALAITILTVSIQTVRAAMTDPVKSLRYE